MSTSERKLLLTVSKQLAEIYDEHYKPERAKELRKLIGSVEREAAATKKAKGLGIL